MERNEILAAARADMLMEAKAGLRSSIWFGFGYYLAEQEGNKAVKEYMTDVRAIVKAMGYVKQTGSNRANLAQAVGKRFKALFGKELASFWESDAHMVQACYLAAAASGATTATKMMDWAEHGDPLYSVKLAEAKEAEKAAEKAAKLAEAAERVAATEGAPLAMGFDDVPVPKVVVQKMDSADPADPFAGMDDAALAALIAAATAEMDRRIAAAAKAAA